jgi:asparagine synthase (glutamine-hydrolysing)
MCGIAGVFHYAEVGREVDQDLLVRMTRVLAHRGPDGEGFYREGPIGLGHRRLAIVDLSPSGAQPMSNASRSCWLAYNGEFYNHRTYRERLSARGYRFRGTSDTETLLYLLEEEGPDSLAGAAGIFALAFWDARCRQLTLARDPLGVKQLYFHDDGRRLLFASEIKALFACPDVPREPDPEAINQYLHFHTPLFERTFFKHVRQLRAGEYLCVSRYGMRAQKYWSLSDFNTNGASPNQRVAELREQLSAVVGEQLMADVPVGSFFSAGIDSSAVAAYASKNGNPPECFGAHFSGQGVIDERPYQEAAAKQLNFRLNLIAVDGSSFPDDMFRLMYYQDQPVIGPAMFPMYYVSRLAAAKVKVCLGGQGADEIFGGYARYALMHPVRVVRSWVAGRRASSETSRVGGNLGKQLRDRENLYRLWAGLPSMRNWEDRYFQHFAKVPEALWRPLIVAPEFFDREQCRDIFHDTLRRSAARDPADKVMHWDMQTYLTGLFQQDDRMAMAASLESRVPLADPRLVQFAFRTGFDLKFRGGATKWLLRRAVADVLPADILNRRKVGFDTPVEKWIKEEHKDFVRDVLLSSRARNWGIFDPSAIAALLEDADRPFWLDLVWKILCIESWASIFLDGKYEFRNAHDESGGLIYETVQDPRKQAPTGGRAHDGIAGYVQEVREMGLRGTLARLAWEAKLRSGMPRLSTLLRQRRETVTPADDSFRRPPVFSDPLNLAATVCSRVGSENVARLVAQATEATRGRILCFGRWFADFGNPIDWHRTPLNGRRWNADRHWSRSLAAQKDTGDIKLTWEAARFPHAYILARAAAFEPQGAQAFSDALTCHVAGFVERNPVGFGIHWRSGQEIAIRSIAWLFGIDTLSRLSVSVTELEQMVLRNIRKGAEHIAKHIGLTKNSVNNNHLISEALGLYLAGAVCTGEDAREWIETGREILCEEAERQFYADGAYLQQSHNYHRNVLQLYLCATALAKSAGRSPEKAWLKAMDRSLEFLLAHQNPADGRLPNYGANDGSMPCILSSCDFADFRPVLQAVSVACRGERIYKPGPWDEEAAWFCGLEALSAPLRRPAHKSISFTNTGYHVLRGDSCGSFAAFRCGTVLERFSQIDMLHTDIWWQGHNVLVDPGSYLYNGPQAWHDHFYATASHNTVVVDGRDQMLHFRKFRNLHLAKAALLHFEDQGDWALCEGEHYGYKRHAGNCVHRRSILFVKSDVWIVADQVYGSGLHCARLHWLGGPFPYAFDESMGHLELETPSGSFSIAVLSGDGRPLSATVVAGRENKPRGWLSRYYGEKVPVPSLAAEVKAELPIVFVSILCAGGKPDVEATGDTWSVRSDCASVEFQLRSGSIEPMNVYTESLSAR